MWTGLLMHTHQQRRLLREHRVAPIHPRRTDLVLNNGYLLGSSGPSGTRHRGGWANVLAIGEDPAASQVEARRYRDLARAFVERANHPSRP